MIKFQPFVGKNYASSIWKQRVMALGESHYCANPSDAISTITQDIIMDLYNPNSTFEYYKNTYTKFVNSLSGIKFKWKNFEDIEQIWNSIIFYNYVQFPISSARKAPTKQEFTDSEDAFWEILEKYRPNKIIVWGQRLYKHLPQKGYQLPDIIAPNGKAIKTFAYTLQDGTEIQLLPIYHPSGPFSSEYWHNIINKFLNRK